MGTMNAITKRFMERLVCYAYWPYGALAPKLRKSVTKMAVGVTSSAMPGVMARFSCKTGSLLKSMARITGSKMLKVHYLGLKGKASGELLTTAERNSMFKQGKDLATKLQANL
jgi:multimeric flavodoxin WrbA